MISTCCLDCREATRLESRESRYAILASQLTPSIRINQAGAFKCPSPRCHRPDGRSRHNSAHTVHGPTCLRTTVQTVLKHLPAAKRRHKLTKAPLNRINLTYMRVRDYRKYHPRTAQLKDARRKLSTVSECTSIGLEQLDLESKLNQHDSEPEW